MQPPEERLAYHDSSIDIDASPEAVYALVSDITRMGEWSPEAVGVNTSSLLHRQRGDPDILANDLLRRLSTNQPRRALKPELRLFRLCRPDVDMVVGVIADRVPHRGNLFEPCDLRLFQHAAHTEKVNHTAKTFDDASGLK